MFARLTALLLAISSLLIITPAHAASSSSITTVSATTNPIPSYVSPTSPLYTDLLVNNLFHSFSCIAIGQSMIGQPCLTYQVTKNAQGMIQSVPVLSGANLQGGALGAVTGVIAGLYQNPPVRTYDYLASVGQNLGIVKTANAQVGGLGAQVLNPILKLWQVSRNISYILMIIIFLVVGMMIMFRNKINPQTVITAQAALPGLVIGLIMITFSYFFAGLISDMAFVGTNVVGYYFVAAQGKLDDDSFREQLNLTQKISADNALSLMAPLTGIVTRERAQSVSESIISKLGDAINPVRIMVFWLTAQFLMPIAGGIPPPFGLIAGPVLSILGGVGVNAALPFFLGYFLSFAATLALIYQMIKLLIKLIMTYLTIIFLTISAPFQFLIASLPGRQGMTTGWILNMVGNILVFPAVVAVFYFVAFILGPDLASHCPEKGNLNSCLFKVSNNQPSGGFIAPAYAQTGSGKGIVGNTTFPLLGGMDLSFIRILLAFGALMALPTIPDIVTKSIGRGGQAGAALGQEIMGGFGKGQGYAKQTYMGGLNWAQGAKTSVFGEKTFTKVGTKWKPTMGKPGLRDKIDWS